MQTDLTIRADDGTDYDLAILAPAGTQFADVAAQLATLAPNARPQWSGRRRVDAHAVVGQGALAAGSILTAQRGDDVGAVGARLEIVGGRGAGRGVPIGTEPVTAGRDQLCELVVPDARVSRRHVEFAASPTSVTVADLESTNGTWVDSRQCREPIRLKPESLVRIGDTFLAASTASDVTVAMITTPEAPVVTLPSEPRPDGRPRVQWAAMLIPALAGVGLAWAMHSLAFLAFAALTPVALLAGVCGDRMHWRRARRGAVAEHRRARHVAAAEIAHALAAETRCRRQRDPHPANLRRIATGPAQRQWVRGRGGPGLLRARVGLGDLASSVLVEQDGRTRPAGLLRAVPIGVDLADGPVGLMGPRPVRVALAHWIVAQLAALCSPTDVALVVLTDDDAMWRWVRWLPHVHRVAVTAADRVALVATLSETARARRSHAGQAGASWPGPWVVVIFDDPDNRSAVAALLADGPRVGISALCLDGAQRDVTATTTIDAGGGGLVPDCVDLDWAETIARALTPLPDLQDTNTLPDECRLVDLLCVDPASAQEVRERWRHSDSRPTAVLGVGADGRVGIDLARDGPHALIAGTTGSGKSELLQTLVVALAVEHPPSEISFLLVDYKGGAAFAGCAGLPHAIGLVTDLDEHLSRRVLASLDSEIRRREALFAAAGTSDLTAFQATGARLSRLIVVVDEFATLVEEQPQFVAGLVAIAQRGRSLGLHLVLATQRPAGVISPEIRANMAVRICLRVTGAVDSRDVIDDAVAAEIHRDTPGRGYLRIGTSVTQFQTALITARTEPEQIRVVPLDDWRRMRADPEPTSDADLVRFVRTAQAAADGEPAPHTPWLPPLPTVLTVDQVPDAVDHRAVVGLVDLPARQRRDPLAVDLDAGGTVLIVGAGRSGRSTALRTLAQSAAALAAPDALELHVLDATGSGLADLARLPHAGTIATARDGFELTSRLVRRLAAEFGRRRDSTQAQPALLVLIDGWEALAAASDDYDGGRTAELLLTLLPDAPAAGATVAVTGGRAALAPRLAAHAAIRLVLHLHDASDYVVASVDGAAIPSVSAPGRGVRVVDGAEFQFALPRAEREWGSHRSGAFRLRALPSSVSLDSLTPVVDKVILGVGGDDAAPLSVDLLTSNARMLIAGPPRAGRSTALCTLLAQLPPPGLIVAAPERSPMARAARARGSPVLRPDDELPELIDTGVLLVDDAELFADTAVGDAITRWLRADRPRRSAVVAARSDAVALAFRGLIAEVRQARCGILLQAGPVDGELLGARLPRARGATVAGRGVLVPDPTWQLGLDPLPIQVASG